MEENKIIKGNNLILEFIGYKLVICNNGLAWESPFERHVDDVFKIHGMLWREWEWIMPAVRKIYATGISGGITYDLRNALVSADIEAVWEEVVEIIQWYNQNQKP